MKSPTKLILAIGLAASCASALFISAVSAAPEKIKIRLPLMPGIAHLAPERALGLGYFESEGIELELVNVMNYRDEDFFSTELLNDGTMDAAQSGKVRPEMTYDNRFVEKAMAEIR
jgi:ABC-type nitrate/sulfonate/bicarbonate transport system substrate-binding protein